jgi:hypothetical protein
VFTWSAWGDANARVIFPASWCSRLRHGREIDELVNRNRRVTVAWHRNNGPALLQVLIRTVLAGKRVPRWVAGKPADQCVSDVLDAFATHGSDSLRSDIDRWRSSIPRIGGKDYGEILDDLRLADGDHTDLRELDA